MRVVRPLRPFAAGCVLLVAVPAGVATGQAVSPSALQQEAQARARELFPEAEARVEAQPAGDPRAGRRVTLTLDAGRVQELPGQADPAFRKPADAESSAVIGRAQLGWQLDLITGVIAARDTSVTEVATRWPGISAADAQLVTIGVGGRAPDPVFTFPRAGSVAPADALEQLQSNVDTLRRALPAGVIEAQRLTVRPVDAAAQLYGLEADLLVPELADLAPRIADLTDGLAVGLAGGPDAIIEGLAINVVDDRGQRGGWWRAPRAGVGFGVPGPLGKAQQTLAQAVFANLTGGPGRSQSVSSGTFSVQGQLPATLRLRPGRGLGPVSLGMRRRAVERRLGQGRRTGGGESIRYRFYGQRLSVRYGPGRRVVSVGTPSPRVTLGGRSLVNRRATMKRLAGKGWDGRRCPPVTYAIRDGHAGVTTEIRWRKGRLERAGVYRTGLGGCSPRRA